MSQTQTNLWTYADVIEHLIDFLNEDVKPKATRDCRRAVLSAYRTLANDGPWTYLYDTLRIVTVAPQSTGTVTYQHSSGANPRQLTLAGATWPSWSRYGNVLIGKVAYEVAALIDSTHLQLSVNSNPGDDITTATSYTIYRDQYPMPCDFIAAHMLHTPANWGGLQYVHPREWLADRTLVNSIGTPRFFTFMGADDFLGAMSVRFYPPPDQVAGVEGVYHRRPRPLLIDQYQAGTATTTSGSAAIVGTGTNWTQAHVGSVIRFSDDALNYPTGLVGSNPYAEERAILSVQDATHLTVDANVGSTLTAVKYRISDPVDLEEGTMFTAFLRCCEKELSIARNMKTKPECIALYRDALLEARAADSRHAAMRGVGWQSGRVIQWKSMPLIADVS